MSGFADAVDFLEELLRPLQASDVIRTHELFNDLSSTSCFFTADNLAAEKTMLWITAIAPIDFRVRENWLSIDHKK